MDGCLARGGAPACGCNLSDVGTWPCGWGPRRQAMHVGVGSELLYVTLFCQFARTSLHGVERAGMDVWCGRGHSDTTAPSDL